MVITLSVMFRIFQVSKISAVNASTAISTECRKTMPVRRSAYSARPGPASISPSKYRNTLTKYADEVLYFLVFRKNTISYFSIFKKFYSKSDIHASAIREDVVLLISKTKSFSKCNMYKQCRWFFVRWFFLMNFYRYIWAIICRKSTRSCQATSSRDPESNPSKKTSSSFATDPRRKWTVSYTALVIIRIVISEIFNPEEWDWLLCHIKSNEFFAGYEFTYPFMSAKVEIRTDDNHVEPIYKQFIHMDYTNLFFMGLPAHVVPFPMFYIQAQYILGILEGRVQLPSPQQMRKEFEAEKQSLLDQGIPVRTDLSSSDKRKKTTFRSTRKKGMKHLCDT